MPVVRRSHGGARCTGGRNERFPELAGSVKGPLPELLLPPDILPEYILPAPLGAERLHAVAAGSVVSARMRHAALPTAFDRLSQRLPMSVCRPSFPQVANPTPPNGVRLPPPMCSLYIPCVPDLEPWE